MGQRYNDRMAKILDPDAPWRDKPITVKQRALLKSLCEEQDGECDEAWLDSLTAGEASFEIDERKRDGR